MSNRLALAGFAVACLAACTPMGWSHDYGASHELAGTIIDVRRQRVIGEAELVEELTRADFVLLGEKHDNIDHHRLQARLVEAMGERVSALVLEMIGAHQQQAVVEYLAERPGDTSGLAAVLDWRESGWPDWRHYEPIVAAALENGAELMAGNLADATVAGIMERGFVALPPDLVAETGLDRPLDPASRDALRRTLVQAHCGYAPDDHLDNMLLVQRARDARMADRLALTAGRGIGVLIAGGEHVRRDWGVPSYLERLAPDRQSLSLAFIEVSRDMEGLPLDLPYDFVWLTPRSQPYGFDPCEAFRRELEALETRRPSPAPEAAG